jgi:hypothetical protein
MFDSIVRSIIAFGDGVSLSESLSVATAIWVSRDSSVSHKIAMELTLTFPRRFPGLLELDSSSKVCQV